MNGEAILTPWANSYEKDAHVTLEAIADECCEFIDWTINGAVIDDSSIILNMTDNFTAFVTCSITCEPTPTPTPEPTTAPTPEPTPTPTPEPTTAPTPEPTPTPTPEPTTAPTPEPTPTPTPEPTTAPTPEPTPTPTPEPTTAPTPEPTPTPTPKPTAEPTIYTLTITAEGDGYTSPLVGTYVYDTVTVVEITATPNFGWAFIGWSGNVSDPIANSTTVVVDSAKVVTANFFAASLYYIPEAIPTPTPEPTPTVTPSPVTTPTPASAPTPTPTPAQSPVMVSLRVAGGSGSIGVGDKQQFTALARYSDGITIDITGDVAWRSSNTEVATIDSSGLARGIGGGKTEIIASKNGKTGTFTLTVVSAPVLTLAPMPTPTPTPTPITAVAAVPWSLIGGVCAFALVAGLSSFFLVRGRRGKSSKEGSSFVMIRSPSSSDKGTGGEMWYILSEGHVIKVSSRQDHGTGSELSE